MKKFVNKYFLETTNYGMRLFLIGVALIAAGWTIIWNNKLGGFGGFIYLLVVLYLSWSVYKLKRKSNNIKSEDTRPTP